MREYLIKEAGQFYKANLHCHSDMSDGKLSPRALKAYYKSNGYAILAITDHEILAAHPELDDEDFLTVPGYEIAVNDSQECDSSHLKTCHMNLYPRDKQNLRQPFFERECAFGNSLSHLDKIDIEQSENFVREYTPDCINKIVQTATEKGFLVTYNHPTWSLETYAEYTRYDGFFAMEIYNHGCIHTGPEFNQQVYDAMLRSGKRLYCVATDDNHNRMHGTPLDDSLGGFTMIKAEALTHEAVISALEQGDFYASTGPYIEELFIEDNQVHLKCSDAVDVFMHTSGRDGLHCAAENGQTLRTAVFSLADTECWYYRFEVKDAQGRSAYTNAYFK